MTKLVFMAGMYDFTPSVISLLCSVHGVYPYVATNSSFYELMVKKAGYGEPHDVVQINEALLSLNESRWFALQTPTHIQSWQTDQDLFSQLSTYCAHLPHDTYVNDPRICYTLPFWLEALKSTPVQIFLVIPLVHPQTFAQHMQYQYGMPTRLALALWVAYTLSIEFFSRSVPRLIVPYDTVLHDWQSACQTLVSFLAPQGVTPHATIQIDAHAHMLRLRQSNPAPNTSFPDFPLVHIAQSVFDVLQQPSVVTESLDALHAQFASEISAEAYTYDFKKYDYVFQRKDFYLEDSVRWLESRLKELQVYHVETVNNLVAEVNWRKEVIDQLQTELNWHRRIQTSLPLLNWPPLLFILRHARIILALFVVLVLTVFAYLIFVQSS